MATTRELLERHNPVLVMFPEDPEATRPGAKEAGAKGWGDYHPCSVDFFLKHAHLRKQRPGYNVLGPLVRGWKPLEPTGIAKLRQELQSAASPLATQGWELDVAPIPSQYESEAWRAYGEMLPAPQTVYARLVPVSGGASPAALLQYWYLYVYNDFRNNHEADWELVTVQLDDNGEAAKVGLSRHFSGGRRMWSQVERDGDRPIVHVALGSHAGYFEYKEDGHEVLGLEFVSGLPWPVALAVSFVKRLRWLRRLRDITPADADLNEGAPAKHAGERVCPTLHVLPDVLDGPLDPEWWWLRYRGRWGSSRARVAGTVGVKTPWHVTDEGPMPDYRWSDPDRWLKDCVDA